jgi:hypothetical protein
LRFPGVPPKYGSTCFLLLAIACANALYWPALTHGTFIRDDWFNFEQRPASHWLNIWTGDWLNEEKQGGIFYRPLVRVSMLIDGTLFGIDPFPNRDGSSGVKPAEEIPDTATVRSGLFGWETPFHVVNNIMHGINAWLVGALALTLGFSGAAAIAAAFFFLIHPAHPGAVYWLSGRTDLMVTLWILVTVILAAKTNRRIQRFFLLAAALALASKETALALPFLIPIILFGLPQRPKRGRLVGTIVGIILLTAAYVAARVLVFGGPGGYFHGQHLYLREVTAGFHTILGALFVPWQDGVRVGLLIWCIAALIGLVIPHPRRYYVALSWILASIFPLAGLQATISDGARYLYLPSVGIGLFAAELTERVLIADRLRKTEGRRAWWQEGLRLAGTVAGVLWVVIYLGCLALNMGAWNVGSKQVRASLTITKSALEQTPEDHQLVMMNEPRHHFSSYVQDYWSINQALEYLSPYPIDNFKANIDAAQHETTHVLVFHDKPMPYGYRFSRAMTQWDPETGDQAIYGGIEKVSQIDFLDAANIRWRGDGALLPDAITTETLAHPSFNLNESVKGLVLRQWEDFPKLDAGEQTFFIGHDGAELRLKGLILSAAMERANRMKGNYPLIYSLNVRGAGPEENAPLELRGKSPEHERKENQPTAAQLAWGPPEHRAFFFLDSPFKDAQPGLAWARHHLEELKLVFPKGGGWYHFGELKLTIYRIKDADILNSLDL